MDCPSISVIDMIWLSTEELVHLHCNYVYVY